MIHKLKLHLLTHGRYDVLRLGPLLGCSTETFECFNGVWRYCSIFSNRLAPSRDIAFQLADQEAFKHRITGGYWQGHNEGWIQAGWGVQDLLTSHPIVQRLIGWTPEKEIVPGAIKVLIHRAIFMETYTCV